MRLVMSRRPIGVVSLRRVSFYDSKRGVDLHSDGRATSPRHLDAIRKAGSSRLTTLGPANTFSELRLALVTGPRDATTVRHDDVVVKTRAILLLTILTEFTHS